ICTASTKYQKLKLEQLKTLDLPDAEYDRQVDEVLSKECLCIGLSNAAPISYEEPFLKKLTAVTICPGPNIVNFSKVASLQEMTDHIYGRKDIIQKPNRPSMFVAELKLYIDFLKKEIERTPSPATRDFKSWEKFSNNLLDGIEHYGTLLSNYSIEDRFQFEMDLEEAKMEVIEIKKGQLELG
ncbi:MAG TPA: hypothetical protein VKX40_08530, partial [Aequorivita sp.]|nr:hypothetical protein [Aequorivita sp.]